ncbi:GMC family oxidoreductase [Shewanella eurypsychrophilus]|uniref:GMC family oxidoreductase n=1 Tax=Shewanella eurypsychrophilus TaxID=2593656 RepID=A0ABX6VA29_9GAMM|nr:MULTISPECIES: GMC family oxidoreductase [Shewanella]QFU24086.1 oxidoreductase [Shewanella sp. YLB-09]QPG59295.1 GMC family oxidoreductase [Shewanella eurypsychrophilus]
MKNNKEFDICIVGSGAGAGPIAYELAKAGYKVAVLEKGKWFKENDFFKDEQLGRHSVFRSQFNDERHILEEPNGDGSWSSDTTAQFWGGNIVGGATNFMSAYFHRLKPQDFRLVSEYGDIEGANNVDWPISYDELEPYYTKVEQVVGVSGKVVKHPNLEPRSTKDYPFPPTAEHPVAQRFDIACKSLKLHPLPMARGILSIPFNGRLSCEYSGYCGSYGCHSGAKASSRAALLDAAVKTGNCKIVTQAKVYRLNTDESGKVTSADYFDLADEDSSKRVSAKLFVVACYSIESARLLLSSTGKRHPDGIGNRYQQVGKNLHCCAGGTGHGVFEMDKLKEFEVKQLKVRGPFFNRALQDWYEIDDKSVSDKPIKGGTLDFVFDPPSPTGATSGLKWQGDNLLWGTPLKQKIKSHFTQSKDFKFEVFCDWLTNDECYVSLDKDEKDRWGQSVAKVRAGFHSHDEKVAQYLVDRGVEVMKAMGAHKAWGNVFTQPTSNLVAGGCRFGNDPKTSVLDKNCKVHDCDNLYVTDGSFMPNGGSVTPTFTIYANAFRVADKILERLSKAQVS